MGYLRLLRVQINVSLLSTQRYKFIRTLHPFIMEDHSHDDEDDEDPTDTMVHDMDFMDSEPTPKEQQAMRKTNKRPSDWLRLLCKDWAIENEDLVEGTDQKFVDYKPFLKGYLSSQLLCRLSIPQQKEVYTDFWAILGIQDEFDKAYIIAQIERFCTLYQIRAGTVFLDETTTTTTVDSSPFLDAHDAATAAAAAAAAANAMPFMNDGATAAAVAAASEVVSKGLNKKQASEVSKAHRLAKDAEKALEQERRQNVKREQRRMSQERKELKMREREQIALKKAAERMAREQTREERRRKKLELREQRERFAQEQKEAALKRAAELVASNRVPIEITRGAAAAKAAMSVVVPPPVPRQEDEAAPAPKKRRSAIVVSTARDLNEIVTHSKNLWAKYNAVAKEHNQKVNWITVAKELGIHVKVREKYARMHFRAEQRGFDWEALGHWKIKDHPDIFLEPTQAEQKAKMPPPLPQTSRTVVVTNTTTPNTVLMEDGEKVPIDDAAVAAAAAVVDAAGVTGTPGVEDGTAAAMSAAMDHSTSSAPGGGSSEEDYEPHHAAPHEAPETVHI